MSTMSDKLKITKQGDIIIDMLFVDKSVSNDVDRLAIEVMSFMAKKINFILFGEGMIQIKFWDQDDKNPTILSTGLKWTTFKQDGDILILDRSPRYFGDSLYVSISKKSEFKHVFSSDRLKEIRATAAALKAEFDPPLPKLPKKKKSNAKR